MSETDVSVIDNDDGWFVMGDGSSSGVPVGSYIATFDGYVNTTTSKGDTMRWTWTITTGAYAGHKASTLIDRFRTGPTVKNKLGRMLFGMLGRTLAVGERFNVNSLIGQRFIITVTTSQDGKSTRVETAAPLPTT